VSIIALEDFADDRRLKGLRRTGSNEVHRRPDSAGCGFRRRPARACRLRTPGC